MVRVVRSIEAEFVQLLELITPDLQLICLGVYLKEFQLIFFMNFGVHSILTHAGQTQTNLPQQAAYFRKCLEN
jgi:hypothetical protein